MLGKAFKMFIPSPIVDLAGVVIFTDKENFTGYHANSYKSLYKCDLKEQADRVAGYAISFFTTIGTAAITFAASGDLDAALLTGFLASGVTSLAVGLACGRFGDFLEINFTNMIALGIFSGDEDFAILGLLGRQITVLLLQ